MNSFILTAFLGHYAESVPFVTQFSVEALKQDT